MYPFLKDASFCPCFCFVHTIAQFSRILRFSHIYCQFFRIRTHGWRKWRTTALTSTIGSEKFQKLKFLFLELFWPSQIPTFTPTSFPVLTIVGYLVGRQCNSRACFTSDKCNVPAGNWSRDLSHCKPVLYQLSGARGTYHPPFSNFLFTNLFSIKFLYFFIISSLFPNFNLFVSIFIQSYINIKLLVSI